MAIEFQFQLMFNTLITEKIHVFVLLVQAGIVIT